MIDSSIYMYIDIGRNLLQYRRSNVKNNDRFEFDEVWGLDDILYLFGLPDDPSKPIKTTYLRAILDD